MSIARTATISVRVEPEAKAGAEKVFERLGLSMSDAINMFCKQAIYQQTLPLDLDDFAPGPESLNLANYTEEDFAKMFDELEEEYQNNKPTTTIDEIYNEVVGRRYD